MESVNASTGWSKSPFMPDNDLRSLQASNTQLVAAGTSQHLDLNLVTNEGDKVTLSLDARTAAAYASFAQVAVDADGNRSAAAGELSLNFDQQEFTLAVEGDLNEDERREVKQVLKALGKMMQDFIHGHLKPILSKARKLQGLETISGLEAHMAYESQVVVAQQTQVVAVRDPNGASAEKVVPAPASSADISTIKPKAAVVAKHMAHRLKSMKTHRRQAMGSVQAMLGAYRDQAAGLSASAARLIDFIGERLNAEVGATTQA